MSIKQFYKDNISKDTTTNNSDFKLFQYNDNILVGFDSDRNLCVVVLSNCDNRNVIHQRTKMISVECNRPVKYQIDGREEKHIVHVLSLKSSSEKDREIFLELVYVMLKDGDVSDEDILDIFRTLTDFFANNREPSDNELTGLYAELDSIEHFQSALDWAKYWQSRDRLKFDVSFSDSVKGEIKATTKSFRVHHFKHEQLISAIYEIFIISYMFRYDDEGDSLLDLITRVKPLVMNHPKKLLRLNLFIKNTPEERLLDIKFNRQYTEDKRKIYKASDVPKFGEATPDGVANAEYDCSLDNVPTIQEDIFVRYIQNVLSESEDENGETI